MSLIKGQNALNRLNKIATQQINPAYHIISSFILKIGRKNVIKYS